MYYFLYMSQWAQIGFQDGKSLLIEEIIFFHDHRIIVLTLIISLVIFAAFNLFTNSFSCRNLVEAQIIEFLWTLLPAFLLIFLALPSLRLLYLLDDTGERQLTLKSIGHQWYWSYEYSDFKRLEFDSYIVPTNELIRGEFRLLDVDHRVVLPMDTNIRVVTTSADVIHSWAVPSLGVKADAIPGRLNQLSFTMKDTGVFYGQCSEICGANHSFIPIVIERIPVKNFISWIHKIAN